MDFSVSEIFILILIRGENMRVYIWGCGDYGKRILSNLIMIDDIDILGYIDNNQDMWGKKIKMFQVFPPDSLKTADFDKIFIAVNNPFHIRKIKRIIEEKYNFPKENVVDIFADYRYLDLIRDQRINFIIDYSKWIYKNNINGNVAECGVFRGDSAKFLNRCFFDRKLYLCDTFEGFDEKDLKEEKSHRDEYFQKSRFSDKNFFASTSIDDVMKKMIFKDNIIVKKGYFPDSMKNEEDIFSFVNLDMDLYVPMLEGLKYFWKKMSKGGCILLHDYFSEDFSRVEQAVKDFEIQEGIRLTKIPIGDGCSLAIIK